MKHIFIIRHGESEGNARQVEGEYIIDCNIKLTEKGKVQALNAGKQLATFLMKGSYSVTLWISPFERTRQTADQIEIGMYNEIHGSSYETLSEINKDKTSWIRKEDPRLVEQDFGDFDFQFMDKWKYISPHSYMINQARYCDERGRFFARLENGENMLDVYNRISLFVTTRLERDMADLNIIVTHGNASLALKMFLLDEKVESYYNSEVPENGCILHILYDEANKKYTIV